MIDFIKFIIPHQYLTTILENRLLEFFEMLNRDTGEVSYPAVSRFGFGGFKVIVRQHEIEVRGSLHVLFNVLTGKGETNHDDFTFIKLAALLRYLENKLLVNLDGCRVVNIEYAVNVQLNREVLPILKQNTIVHNNRSPQQRRDDGKHGFRLEFKGNGLRPKRYFKVYDKGRHKGRKENIWRWEIKEAGYRQVKRAGVESVGGLLNADTLTKLGDNLALEFDKMIMVDTLECLPQMTPRERKIYEKGLNPREWEMMPDKWKRKRFRESFMKILDKYELHSLKSELKNGIISKWSELKNRYQIDTFSFLLKRDIGTKKEVILSNDLVKIGCMKNGEIWTEILPIKKNKTATKSTPDICCNRSVFKNQCVITKLDISHQRKGAKFLSEKTVLKLLKSRKKSAADLIKKYLPKKRTGESLEKQAYYIAHNIRNAESNKRHELKVKVRRYEFSLFPI